VYLDQWVWVRLAKAAVGRPELPSDTDVLSAVRDAAKSGVAFPLSSTHYFDAGCERPSAASRPGERHGADQRMLDVAQPARPGPAPTSHSHA
jgi:hypothetical protein